MDQTDLTCHADAQSVNAAYVYDLKLEKAPGAFIPAEHMRSPQTNGELPGRLLADVVVNSVLVGLYGEEQAQWVCRRGAACVVLGTWTDGTFKVRLRIELADNSHGASSRVFVGRLPELAVEVLDVPLKGRILAANVNQETSHPKAPRPHRRVRPFLVGAVVAVAVLLVAVQSLLTRSAGSLAMTTDRLVVTPGTALPIPVEGSDTQGNGIVNGSCLDVGTHACLDVDPQLNGAVTLLETTSPGPQLLRTAADAGVRVRIGTVPADALADFRSDTRMVTLGPKLKDTSGRAQASVLAHELHHVADWSKVGPLFNNSFNCYQTEASAFQTEAAVWTQLRGNVPPSDAVESHLDDLAQGVKTGGSEFWIHIAGEYAHECMS